MSSGILDVGDFLERWVMNLLCFAKQRPLRVGVLPPTRDDSNRTVEPKFLEWTRWYWAGWFLARSLRLFKGQKSLQQVSSSHYGKESIDLVKSLSSRNPEEAITVVKEVEDNAR
jgi:hypothetical protein